MKVVEREALRAVFGKERTCQARRLAFGCHSVDASVAIGHISNALADLQTLVVIKRVINIADAAGDQLFTAAANSPAVNGAVRVAVAIIAVVGQG